MTKKCPFCLAEIPTEARKCQHCGEWVEKPPTGEGTTAMPEAAKPVAPFKDCPSCQAAYPEGAILCVQCGHDARTGQKRYLRHQPPAPPKEEGADAAASPSAPTRRPIAPFVIVGIVVALLLAGLAYFYAMLQEEGGAELLWTWGPIAGGVALGLLLLVVFVRWWLVMSDG